MELLGKLGIDVKLLLAQIINFTLLLIVLNKFLYKPIIKKIEADEKKLNQAQAETAQLEATKQKFSKEKNKEILKAKKRSKEIIKEAEDIAKKIVATTKAETKKEKEAVIKQIKSRLNEINKSDKTK